MHYCYCVVEPRAGREMPALSSRSGIELERRPIERLPEHRAGVCRMEHLQLGVAEGGGGVYALAQFAVKRIHELRRGDVAHFPQGPDDIVSASAQKRPGKPHKPFPRIRACARTIAGRNGYEVGVEMVRNDVPRI